LRLSVWSTGQLRRVELHWHEAQGLGGTTLKIKRCVDRYEASDQAVRVCTKSGGQFGGQFLLFRMALIQKETAPTLDSLRLRQFVGCGNTPSRVCNQEVTGSIPVRSIA
jgi:hypothetical protein